MPFNPDLCAGCPIAGEHQPVDDVGPEDARFLVITDAPSAANAKKGRLLTDMQMQVFAGEMQRIGFDREDFRFTPACLCPYNPDMHTNKTITAIHKHCRQHLVQNVEESQAEVIIPLGATASTAAFGKATKITKVRGLASNEGDLGRPIFPLLSPGLVVKYPQNEPLFQADVASFGRFVGSGFDANSSITADNKYEIVEDLEFLIRQDPEILAFDTEGTGLRWYQEGCDVRTYRPGIHKGSAVFQPRFQILTMQFTIEPGSGYMLVWDHPEAPIKEQHKARLRNQLRRLLCDPRRIVVGHNLKYDNVALWMKEDIRFRIGGDTLMLAALYDENAPEKNLDVMTKIHVPEMAGYADRFNSTVNKARMWETPLSELKDYGCGDTDAAYRLYLKLEEEIAQDDGQWAHYCNVSIPGLNALAAMETRGMYTDDKHALPEFKEFMAAEVEAARVELLRQVPREVKRDVLNDYLSKPANKKKTAEDALSFTRSEFLKQLLFTHKKGFRLKPKVFTKSTQRLPDHMKEPSTSSKDHLPFFFDSCPFTVQLAEYIKDHGLLTKSVIKFEENYIRQGKVRPTYSLMRTVTGRTSSEDPNGQNYPKRGERAKVYRKMFVAPPGYFVCELDLSQAELRIAASMSGDPTMLKIYREAGDIHTATAMIVMGVTQAQWDALPKEEKKLARTKAKSVNFGFLYGMGWRKFIGFAKTQYGVDFTEAEAKRVREGFFKKYRMLAPWHEATRQFAMKHKYVRSYSGRIRHLPMIDSNEEGVQMEAIRQAINSPVQEFGSSLGVMALGRMNEEIDPKYLQVVGFIHDAIVVYVKKEYLDWGMRTVKRYMQTNPLQEWFGTTVKCPIVADCGFGLNLGEIIECEGFSLDEPFNYAGLVDKEGKPLIEVPPQRIPPHEGRLQRSAYTTPDDLEDENAEVAEYRPRMVRGAASEEAIKRVARSKRQMVINKRNQEAKREAEKVIRRIRRRPANVE